MVSYTASILETIYQYSVPICTVTDNWLFLESAVSRQKNSEKECAGFEA